MCWKKPPRPQSSAAVSSCAVVGFLFFLTMHVEQLIVGAVSLCVCGVVWVFAWQLFSPRESDNVKRGTKIKSPHI